MTSRATVNDTVSEQMTAYGFTLVSTLITKIALPAEVEDSMKDQRRPAHQGGGAGPGRGGPHPPRDRGAGRGRGHGEVRRYSSPTSARPSPRASPTRSPRFRRRALRRRGQPALHVHAVDRDDGRVRQGGQGRPPCAAERLHADRGHVRADGRRRRRRARRDRAARQAAAVGQITGLDARVPGMRLGPAFFSPRPRYAFSNVSGLDSVGNRVSPIVRTRFPTFRGAIS